MGGPKPPLPPLYLCLCVDIIQVNVERVTKALKECGEKGKQLILAAVPLIAQEPDWADTIRDLQVRTPT